MHCTVDVGLAFRQSPIQRPSDPVTIYYTILRQSRLMFVSKMRAFSLSQCCQVSTMLCVTSEAHQWGRAYPTLVQPLHAATAVRA